MPDSKITALTSISTSTDPANDPLVIVDVSDTSMAATGTTKKVTLNQLLGASGTATLASATITGDLTVDTNTLKVDSVNNRVGIGTASPIDVFQISSQNPNIYLTDSGIAGSDQVNLYFGPNTIPTYSGILVDISNDNFNIRHNSSTRLSIGATGIFTWQNVGGVAGTAMTLNATGLGVGVVPSSFGRFSVQGTAVSAGILGMNTDATRCDIQSYNVPLALNRAGNNITMCEGGGNVGIGVTPSAWWSSTKALQFGLGGSISGRTDTGARSYFASNAFLNSSPAWTYVTTNFATRYEQNDGTHQWHIAPSGTAGNAITFTQAMTLDASGNLLVGTTTNTDAYRTNIQFSGTSVNGLIVKNLASTGGPVLLYLHDSAQTVNTATVSAEYTDSTTQRWRLYKNGGLANYQANNVNLSDVRTKTDIKPLGSYWNKIKSLEVVTFKYKDQTHSDDNIGLIAQQVESVAPELVDADGFGNTPEDGVPLKTIYTTDLYHAAIKALQEAMARIEALEAKLA